MAVSWLTTSCGTSFNTRSRYLISRILTKAKTDWRVWSDSHQYLQLDAGYMCVRHEFPNQSGLPPGVASFILLGRGLSINLSRASEICDTNTDLRIISFQQTSRSHSHSSKASMTRRRSCFSSSGLSKIGRAHV